MDRVNVDPARLQTVDERLRLYTDLARKYGGSTEAAAGVLSSPPPRGSPSSSRARTTYPA